MVYVFKYFEQKQKQEIRKIKHQKQKQSHKDVNIDKIIDMKLYQHEYHQQTVLCDCGDIVNKFYMKIHLKTNKHRKLLNLPKLNIQKPKIKCECGLMVYNASLKPHIETDSHMYRLKYLNNGLIKKV